MIINDTHMLEWGLVGVVIHRVRVYPKEEGLFLPWVQERFAWCEENCQGHFTLDMETVSDFLFDNPDDAFHFKVRWK